MAKGDRTRFINARKRLFHEQRGLCYYCGEPMLLAAGKGDGSSPRKLATLDHIIPLSKGGVKSPSVNCVAACNACNHERGDRDARLFMLEKMGLA